MQRLVVSGEVRPIYGSLGVKRLICVCDNVKWIEQLGGFLVDGNEHRSSVEGGQFLDHFSCCHSDLLLSVPETINR